MTEKEKIGKNMLLTTGVFNNMKTLKMMPATVDCPYVEAFVDRGSGTLVILSKIEKDTFQFIPRVDTDGEAIPAKRSKRNGVKVQEQRVTFRTFEEFYITEPKEVENFVKMFGINLKDVDYKELISKIEIQPESPIIKPQTVILDEKAEPIEKN